jgi:hypothetical protein
MEVEDGKAGRGRIDPLIRNIFDKWENKLTGHSLDELNILFHKV